jgi:hypothetical protein
MRDCDRRFLFSDYRDEKWEVRFGKGFGTNNIRLEREIGGRVNAPRVFATKANALSIVECVSPLSFRAFSFLPAGFFLHPWG